MERRKGPFARDKEIIEYALAHQGRPMTLGQIGQNWGISRQRVFQILKAAGIKGIFLRPTGPLSPRPSADRGSSRTERPIRPRGYLRSKLPEMVALREQGVSLHAIARIFDYDRTTIRRALKGYQAGTSLWGAKRRGRPP